MKKVQKGSVTVEAALILPLLIIFFMQMFSALEMLALYCRMEVALEETAEEVATLLYLKEEGNMESLESLLLSETFVRAEIVRKLGEEGRKNSVLENGSMGISLLRSSILTKENEVRLVLTYRVKPWLSFGNIGKMRLVNHCSISAWRGFEKENKGNEPKDETSRLVYVTEHGSVYHLYRDCRYLDATVYTVLQNELSGKRNEDGKIYYPCEFCAEGDQGVGMYFITPYGTRYHTDPDCIALHKKVQTVSLENVGKKHVCHKCEERSRDE